MPLLRALIRVNRFELLDSLYHPLAPIHAPYTNAFFAQRPSGI
jgi:hypothetical protein